MGKILGSVLIGMIVAAGGACSDASSPATTTNGASGATGSPTGSGGSNNPTSGGPTTSGSAGQPTSGSAGQSGSGSSTGGSGGATGGSGGTSTTDASAPETSGPRDGSTATDAPIVFGDSGPPPKPSVGCGKMAPAMGSRTIMTGGQMGMYNLNIPAGYNPMTPMALGFGFHGSGNGACGPTTGECQGFARLNAVTVYMKSFGVGWEGSTLEQNVTFFNDVLALMKTELCIDENRVFIAGVSSGGQFVDVLSCRYGDALWQVTAVSAIALNPGNCKGTPPALIIHGITDTTGNKGQDTAAMFARRNGCSATPPAGLAKAMMDEQAAFDANPKRVEHVCLDWDACPANSPVRFCISSQVTYSGLTHGWPMIGGMLIGDFQAGLR